MPASRKLWLCWRRAVVDVERIHAVPEAEGGFSATVVSFTLTASRPAIRVALRLPPMVLQMSTFSISSGDRHGPPDEAAILMVS